MEQLFHGGLSFFRFLNVAMQLLKTRMVEKPIIPHYSFQWDFLVTGGAFSFSRIANFYFGCVECKNQTTGRNYLRTSRNEVPVGGAKRVGGALFLAVSCVENSVFLFAGASVFAH
jgi:hypothetical protein